MADLQPYDYPDDDRTLPEFLRDVLLTPIRILTSPFASRIYLRTLLLTLAAFVLFSLSILAYTIFYYTYVPSLGFTLPLHLQFSATHAHHPYALTQLPRSSLSSEQPYDVSVHLCLPRTPENVDAGNFMIDVQMISPREYKDTVRTETEEGQVTVDEHYIQTLAHEARPALLTPEHALVENVRRALWLPALLAGWKSESECLDVTVMESVSFERGWRNLPESVRVEIVAQGPPMGVKALRVESAEIRWTARFAGLRWVLHNHRIVSFVVFTTLFWIVAMGSAVVAWIAISYAFAAISGGGRGGKERAIAGPHGRDEQSRAVKEESEEFSDVSRTFPTSSKQPPLRYSSSRVKQEDSAAAAAAEEEEEEEDALLNVAKEEEADDEDEEADFVLDEPGMAMRLGRDDPGIGTSLESSGPERAASIRRRKREER